MRAADGPHHPELVEILNNTNATPLDDPYRHAVADHPRDGVTSDESSDRWSHTVESGLDRQVAPAP